MVKTFRCAVVEALTSRTWFSSGVETSVEAASCTRFVLGAILFTKGDENLDI